MSLPLLYSQPTDDDSWRSWAFNHAANHYDMAGHGAKAEEHLRAAEHELHDSIEAAKAAR